MFGLLASLSIMIIASTVWLGLYFRMLEEYHRHKARWLLTDPCFRYGPSPLHLLSYRLVLISCGLLLILILSLHSAASYVMRLPVAVPG